jgi:hypothetical protein
MKLLALPFLALLLASSLSAQFFTETFSYPSGPTVPGWTAASGTWEIKNGRLAATGSGWRYINKDGFSAKDCVLDGEFFLVTSSLQFGGLTVRHPGGNSTSSLVMCKIQNNSSPGPATAFNRCYIYEQPGSSVYMDVPLPRPTSVYCRMIMLDQNAWMLVDADKDGLFEMTVGPKVVNSIHSPGLVGMNSYGPCEMDNFKFYNAVITGDAGNPKPQPGNTLQFNLRGAPSTAYQAASSLGRSGIPVGSGRVVPLDADPLFFLSASGAVPQLFGNYAYVLDPTGNGFVRVGLPQIPALVGVTFFTAFVTYDASGITGISNDHQVTIVS